MSEWAGACTKHKDISLRYGRPRCSYHKATSVDTCHPWNYPFIAILVDFQVARDFVMVEGSISIPLCSRSTHAWFHQADFHKLWFSNLHFLPASLWWMLCRIPMLLQTYHVCSIWGGRLHTIWNFCCSITDNPIKNSSHHGCLSATYQPKLWTNKVTRVLPFAYDFAGFVLLVKLRESSHGRPWLDVWRWSTLYDSQQVGCIPLRKHWADGR